MSDYALQTSGLMRSFGSHRVIQGLDLAVPRGCVYGFLGRNGAGKTTTLRMLMGILSPHGGTMTLDEQVVRRTTPRMRRRIGYVSQQQHFWPWMRVGRLGRFVGAFYPTWDHAHFVALLDRLQVDSRQRVGALSGGTRMKLAMTLALAHRPPLLILDEPTAGVDPVTRREILDLLQHAVDEQGHTVLFSTHHISEVEAIGTQVGILHAGAMFWQGPVDRLGDHVRRVTGVVPDGARQLAVEDAGTIAWASPEVWAGVDDAAPVSLEAAFVAIARGDQQP